MGEGEFDELMRYIGRYGCKINYFLVFRLHWHYSLNISVNHESKR